MVPWTGCSRPDRRLQFSLCSLSETGCFIFRKNCPCEVGVYSCNPITGIILHKESNWAIQPKGYSWKDCEFSLENNFSVVAAKLRNVTLGNTTSVYNLFQIAGRDLPKRFKSG